MPGRAPDGGASLAFWPAPSPLFRLNSPGSRRRTWRTFSAADGFQMFAGVFVARIELKGLLELRLRGVQLAL